MLFSVLIANYNNGRYIEEALNSVFSQTTSDWEIIIVDDASTDNSKQILEKYLSNSKIHIYYNDVNKGIGFTKKRCAELATGEICGILDPDDCLLPNAIEEIVKLHNENPNVSLIYSKLMLCDENLLPLSEMKLPNIPKDKTALHIGGLTGWDTYKKKFYLQTLGFDSKYRIAEDQDLYFKMEEVGEILKCEEIYYLYRRHNGSITASKGFLSEYYRLMAIFNAYERRKISKYSNFGLKQYNLYLIDYYFVKYKLSFNERQLYIPEKFQEIHRLIISNNFPKKMSSFPILLEWLEFYKNYAIQDYDYIVQSIKKKFSLNYIIRDEYCMKTLFKSVRLLKYLDCISVIKYVVKSLIYFKVKSSKL